MNYLTVVATMRFAESSDGRTIPCNYQNHPRFAPECELCSGLHYVFIRFSSGRIYSKCYELRTAINFFLDFAISYENGNPRELHLNNLLQITAEVFFGYDLFIKRLNGAKGLATRLKSAFFKVALGHDEGMPILTLPMLGTPTSVSFEPLTKACFKQLSDALKRHIDELYEKIEFRLTVEKSEPYTSQEISALGPLHKWNPDLNRVVKTLIVHDHPFVVSLGSFVDSLKKSRRYIATDNVVEQIYCRFSHYSLLNYTTTKKIITLGEVFESFFPTAMDQVAIAIFVELQTGWNKETIMSTDGDNFEHPLTGALNSLQVLLVSEKHKSQSTGKPYKNPKTFMAPSNKLDKYSAFNLINLAKKLSEPLATLPIECTSEREIKDISPLFLCMRHILAVSHTKSSSGGGLGRFTSAGNVQAWRYGMKLFFEKYEIIEKGVRFTSAKDLNGRLRPTWIRYVRDNKKSPLSLVALQQGHKSIETTDVHYDSSGMAMQQRRERLRTELNNVANLLKQRKFKGMIGKKMADFPNFASMRIFTIPSYDKSLWGCSNSSKPDWPGSGTRFSTSMKCSAIDQCLFCSQVCIFEDSLPFLMERQISIQSELQDCQEPSYKSPLADELRIIEYIFDTWGDEQALKQAARYMRQHDDLLPRDMRLLSIIFED